MVRKQLILICSEGMKDDRYPANEVNVVSNLCFGCYPFSWLLRSMSIDDHVQLPLFAHEGQPYSNLPHYRRFEYEHVTVEQRPYRRPKKATSDISCLGIRIRLELEDKTCDLALFNMALDSKLRGCDLVKLKVSDIAYGNSVSSRATVLQQKTGSPVQFEITKGTREALTALIKLSNLHSKDFFFLSRVGTN